jgi:hypothetical protein
MIFAGRLTSKALARVLSSGCSEMLTLLSDTVDTKAVRLIATYRLQYCGDMAFLLYAISNSLPFPGSATESLK